MSEDFYNEKFKKKIPQKERKQVWIIKLLHLSWLLFVRFSLVKVSIRDEVLTVKLFL